MDENEQFTGTNKGSGLKKPSLAHIKLILQDCYTCVGYFMLMAHCKVHKQLQSEWPLCFFLPKLKLYNIWAVPSEFGTYRLCEQRRFRRACASAQSRQNLRCSLIQAVSQEEPSDRKPDPWPLWMAGHAQLKFVMTEYSKTQIRLARLICYDINKNTKHRNLSNEQSKGSFACWQIFLL